MRLIVKPRFSLIEFLVQEVVSPMEFFCALATVNLVHALPFEESIPRASYIRICELSIRRVKCRVCSRLILAIFRFSLSSPLSISLDLVTSLLESVKIRFLVFTSLCGPSQVFLILVSRLSVLHAVLCCVKAPLFVLLCFAVGARVSTTMECCPTEWVILIVKAVFTLRVLM